MSETLRNNGLDRDERNEFERGLDHDGESGTEGRSAPEQGQPVEGYGDGLDARPIREVYGSERNIRAHGSPIERASDESIRYYFYPTWRSQVTNLFMFAVLSVLCIVASRTLPWLVIPGKLFSWNQTTVMLYFPLLSLIPLTILGKILIKVYDAKYIIDEGGVEAQVGLVSMTLRQPRLRWEDIRGSEPRQTLMERLLGIGTVEIGSAMKEDVEITMLGVANPKAIQLLIQGERERRMQDLRSGNPNAPRIAAVLTD